MRDEIFDRMDELSPAEKKVARSLLANYPAAGLASAATLANGGGHEQADGAAAAGPARVSAAIPSSRSACAQRSPRS